MLNSLSITLETSLSSIGRSSSSASKISTFEPNLDQTLPSSSPITPAPMIASDFGTSVSSRAPELPIIVVPFQGTDGILIGRDPEANIMLAAVTFDFLPF